MQTYPLKELPTSPTSLAEFLGESSTICFELLIQSAESNTGSILFGSRGSAAHYIKPEGSANPPAQNLKNVMIWGSEAGVFPIITVFRR